MTTSKAGLGVALAAAVTWVVGSERQQRAMVGDGAAALLDVANWRAVIADTAYGQLFEAPSALHHAWSLAIEAQFYWLYPLLFVGVMAGVRRRVGRFALVLAALFAASVLVARLGGFDADRIYYGTDTRAAELLAGAVAACIVHRTGLPRPGRGSLHRVVDVAGAVAFAAVAALWVGAPGDLTWIGSGGLGAYAVAGALVVVGASTRGTVLDRGLGVAPLRALGRVSYGFYLFHWPLLLLLAPPGSEAGPLRIGLAFALTAVLAACSYRWIEVPIRTRTGVLGQAGLAAVVVASLLAGLVPSIAVARAAPPADVIDDAVAGSLLRGTDALGTPPAPAEVVGQAEPTADAAPATTLDQGPLAPRAVPLPSRPLRVLVLGDSVAASLAGPLAAWGTATGAWQLGSHARVGCGIVRGGFARGDGFDPPFPPECDAWPDEWPALVDELRPDLVVLAGGFWDAMDRRFADGEPWRGPGDPEHDRRVRDEYELALDRLTGAGVAVAWLDHPAVTPVDGGAPYVHPPNYDPARMERLDQIQDEVAATHPRVRVVRTRDFLRRWPGGEHDLALRPDGLHFSGPDVAAFVDWLGPEVLDVFWSTAPSGAGR